MKVRDLINLLETHAKKYGDNAQIGVHSSDRVGNAVEGEEPPMCVPCREEVYIYKGNISTELDSKGPIIDW